MSAEIIDGFSIAQQVRHKAAEEAAELGRQGIAPCLAVVLVGENPASVSYVTAKERALEEAGMLGKDIRLPGDTTEFDLLGLIEELNQDDSVHGILVQLPLPSHIDEDKVIMAIRPEKDVDGFHPVNVGNMMIGRKSYLPCTPHGVLVLLQTMGIPTAGKHAVIVGRSNIVGKPLSVLLTRREYNATV
ncbi:MAG: bifunctional 5,10-methylene-tetrahydrofolate dehydrogenase/5,10-methylene-tetrahydrofolate cyclohydrolase, partial [Spirochaetaceae bacterium]|nr:bifunctional 5,10-methylene-tetrahydrofolate dehydrogenase/5,10-methylene-tetrahydrofolate cyclohydrolase [Spirochaetaceae bacterium]